MIIDLRANNLKKKSKKHRDHLMQISNKSENISCSLFLTIDQQK